MTTSDGTAPNGPVMFVAMFSMLFHVLSAALSATRLEKFIKELRERRPVYVALDTGGLLRNARAAHPHRVRLDKEGWAAFAKSAVLPVAHILRGATHASFPIDDQEFDTFYRKEVVRQQRGTISAEVNRSRAAEIKNHMLDAIFDELTRHCPNVNVVWRSDPKCSRCTEDDFTMKVHTRVMEKLNELDCEAEVSPCPAQKPASDTCRCQLLERRYRRPTERCICNIAGPCCGAL